MHLYLLQSAINTYLRCTYPRISMSLKCFEFTRSVILNAQHNNMLLLHSKNQKQVIYGLLNCAQTFFTFLGLWVSRDVDEELGIIHGSLSYVYGS